MNSRQAEIAARFALLADLHPGTSKEIIMLMTAEQMECSFLEVDDAVALEKESPF